MRQQIRRLFLAYDRVNNLPAKFRVDHEAKRKLSYQTDGETMFGREKATNRRTLNWESGIKIAYHEPWLNNSTGQINTDFVSN